jgi:hypothetical protein
MVGEVLDASRGLSPEKFKQRADANTLVGIAPDYTCVVSPYLLWLLGQGCQNRVLRMSKL